MSFNFLGVIIISQINTTLLQIIDYFYFYHMSFLQKSYFQRMSAFFLLALILNLQVVKTFHTHSVFLQKTKYYSKNIPIVHEKFVCPICDFQIAKDCDGVVTTFEISSPFQFISIAYNYSLTSMQSVSAKFIARGPPSLG